MLKKHIKAFVGLLITMVVVSGVVFLAIWLIPIRGTLLTVIVALITCTIVPVGVIMSLGLAYGGES